MAVVGATERHGSYAGQTLINLDLAGYPGEVWGVNPGRERVHGRPCFPSLSACPEPPDAVVVAIRAEAVPAVIEEAGALGCGGAVVYGAGFGEMQAGAAAQDGSPHAASGEADAGTERERALRDAALRHNLPVCGPNGNGLVALHERAALWGDALRPFEAGRVALVSQSGNVSVNALNSSRGLRFHTIVSCGNSVVLDPAEWVAQLAREEGVGAVALYLEADGNGALLAEALASCAEHDVGVAVLKVGVSAAGSAAAAAHTGAVAGDQRVFQALVEEAGGTWAADVHELLELAKAMAVPGARRRSAGLARAHLLRGRFRARGRRVRAARCRSSRAGPGHRHAAAHAAPRSRHRGQSARLHGADLGRDRNAARHRGHHRRGPGDRPRARAL